MPRQTIQYEQFRGIYTPSTSLVCEGHDERTAILEVEVSDCLIVWDFCEFPWFSKCADADVMNFIWITKGVVRLYCWQLSFSIFQGQHTWVYNEFIQWCLQTCHHSSTRKLYAGLKVRETSCSTTHAGGKMGFLGHLRKPIYKNHLCSAFFFVLRCGFT